MRHGNEFAVRLVNYRVPTQNLMRHSNEFAVRLVNYRVPTQNFTHHGREFDGNELNPEQQNTRIAKSPGFPGQ
jgi:hypothetical protein